MMLNCEVRMLIYSPVWNLGIQLIENNKEYKNKEKLEKEFDNVQRINGSDCITAIRKKAQWAVFSETRGPYTLLQIEMD